MTKVSDIAPGIDPNTVSDGYHTFGELYESRCVLTAALFNLLAGVGIETCKSLRHNDGELCFGGGWFIVMANLPTGQVSYHYPQKDWDRFKIPEKRFAFAWDGHETEDVHKRLLSFGEYLKSTIKDDISIFDYHLIVDSIRELEGLVPNKFSQKDDYNKLYEKSSTECSKRHGLDYLSATQASVSVLRDFGMDTEHPAVKALSVSIIKGILDAIEPKRTRIITVEQVHELKEMAAAHIAAMEYDFCPEPQEAMSLAEQIDTELSITHFQNGAIKHQGKSASEIADIIVRAIETLKTE